MPELPEVETIVADLRPCLVGTRISRVRLLFPSIVRHPDPTAFVAGAEGRPVESLARRGKYILAGLDGGILLVVHLGMTGQLTLVEPELALAPHTHACFELSCGRQLRYRDPRRFGRLLLGTEEELVAARKLPRLGPDPLSAEFTWPLLRARLKGRRASLKALLLDQAVLAGVGNIYADESCFLARVRPDRPGGELSAAAARRLHGALRHTLELGIRNRGSSISDYVDGLGKAGRQQEELLVYGRGGLPCSRCGRVLRQVRLAGRSTVFCPRCQH